MSEETHAELLHAIAAWDRAMVTNNADAIGAFMAVVVARGVSGGAYAGERFLLTERVSCTYVRRHGHWCCVLTHLSRLDDAD